MPTTVVSKIGATNSPTTMDYSTLQSWEDACPANLVTADKIWRGECYNQGEFTVVGGSTPNLTVSGETTSSACYLECTTANGASFRDHATASSNALKYDSTKGVALSNTGSFTSNILISSLYTRVSNLQFKTTDTTSIAGNTQSGPDTGTVISCCLAHGPSAGYRVWTGTITNSIAIHTGSASGTNESEASAGSFIYNCTFVRASDQTAAGTAIKALYGAATIKNCAFFNWTAICSSTTGSSYNATDLSSVGFGTNNQVSLAYTSQFTGTTSSSPDFRAVGTGSLDLNGTPDATNAPTDIIGQTRNATTPTIGCWEVIAAGRLLRQRGFDGGFVDIMNGGFAA